MNGWSKDGNSMQIRRVLGASRRRPPLTGALLLTCLAGLAFAPTALATTNFTWAGANPANTTDPSSFGWSQALNWSGDAVPTASVAQLIFPDLGGTCDTGVSTDACYVSVDDFGSLAADQLRIDDYWPYVILPASTNDTITLGGGGILAQSSPGSVTSGYAPDIEVPVILGQTQYWNLEGSDLSDDPGNGLEVDSVEGDYGLNVSLSDGAIFYTTMLNTGAFEVDGNGSVVAEQLADGTDAELPASGTTLAGGATLYVESPGATSGPIAIESGQPQGLVVGDGGAPDSTLSLTGGLTLTSNSNLEFDIDDNGSTPGADFSELTTTGNVALGNATLYLVQGTDSAGGCAALTAGGSFPIMTVSGSLTGALSFFDGAGTVGLLPGQTSSAFPIDTEDWCPNSPEVDATLTYGTHAITATIVASNSGTTTGGDTTTTGNSTTLPTVPKLAGSSPEISGVAIVGQTLKLTSNGTWSSNPASTFTHQWFACGTTCAPIAGASAETYTTTRADVGHKIEVEVTAKNSQGSATAASNQIGPIVATPAVLPDTPASGPSAGQVRAAVSKLLTPSGKLAKIPALLKDGGYGFTFKAPSGGKVTLSWTATVKHKRVKVASVRVSLKRKGTDKVKLKLSDAGRSLLKRSSGLTLRVTTSFTPSGHSTVSSTKNIRLT